MDREPAHVQEPGKPGIGATVLLVDDEDSVLYVVRRLMEREGFKVCTATDGRKAVDMFQAAKDDIRVVVLDLNMPGMDGEAVYREIVRIKPGVSVILTSGYAGDSVAGQFEPGEIAGFIQKPYQAHMLIGMVRDALA
ncbi:MAG: response regulator [bacterium]